jgi:hypothetical protein
MSFENWVRNNWLERRDSDREEIARLLAIADGRLEDYHKAVSGELSSDVQLGLAYDAIRASATAALRAAGYRVVRGGSEHYRTIEALEFSIDPERKLIPALDTLRRKRNVGAYDDYGLVSQTPLVIEQAGHQIARAEEARAHAGLGDTQDRSNLHARELLES